MQTHKYLCIYIIMRVKFDDEGKAVGKEVFADRWLEEGGNSYIE